VPLVLAVGCGFFTGNGSLGEYCGSGVDDGSGNAYGKFTTGVGCGSNALVGGLDPLDDDVDPLFTFLGRTMTSWVWFEFFTEARVTVRRCREPLRLRFSGCEEGCGIGVSCLRWGCEWLSR
jgi:hypothetical protein